MLVLYEPIPQLCCPFGSAVSYRRLTLDAASLAAPLSLSQRYPTTMIEITGRVSPDDPKCVVDLHNPRGILTLILFSRESTPANTRASLIAELEEKLKDSREQLDGANALLARTQICQCELDVQRISSLVDIVWPDENIRLLLDAELSDRALLSALVRVLKLPTERSDVIELIRVLRVREADKKVLEDSVAVLEKRINQSTTEQDDINARMQRLEDDLATTRCDLVKRDQLLLAKADVERRLEEHLSQAQLEMERLLATAREEAATFESITSSKAAVEKQLEDVLARASEKDVMVEKLTAELSGRTADLETAKKALDTRPACSMDDSSVITTLKSEINILREELNRANPLVVSPVCTSDKRERSRMASDEEDPVKEKIRLLLDGKALDEDVLEGLIKGLKIPATSTTNPPNIKEIMPPANLICLVTNEMWKYGLIQESERFLAATMQTIQAHAMVSADDWPQGRRSCAHPKRSHSSARMQLCPASSGSQTCTKCCRSSARRRTTCCWASGQARRLQAGRSTGRTTSTSCPSSSTTWTASSTTSTTPG
jgi:myosin heavy subunit